MFVLFPKHGGVCRKGHGGAIIIYTAPVALNTGLVGYPGFVNQMALRLDAQPPPQANLGSHKIRKGAVRKGMRESRCAHPVFAIYAPVPAPSTIGKSGQTYGALLMVQDGAVRATFRKGAEGKGAYWRGAACGHHAAEAQGCIIRGGPRSG